MARSRIIRMCHCAIMATIISVMAIITVPLPFTPVPISLATMGVMLAGALLQVVDGMISVFVYLTLGILGLPVFAGFKSGIATLIGPTGGFLVGYIMLAFGIGFLLKVFLKTFKPMAANLLAMTISNIILYTFGCVWYIIYAKVGVAAALTSCVIPFLLGDAFKIIIASTISARYLHIHKNREKNHDEG